jgi:hypothetical protein
MNQIECCDLSSSQNRQSCSKIKLSSSWVPPAQTTGYVAAFSEFRVADSDLLFEEYFLLGLSRHPLVCILPDADARD